MGGGIDCDFGARNANESFNGNTLTRPGSQAGTDFESHLRLSEAIVSEVENLGASAPSPAGSDNLAALETLTTLLRRLDRLWIPECRISHYRRFQSKEDYAALKTGDTVTFLGFEPGSRGASYDPAFSKVFEAMGMKLGDRFEITLPDPHCADHPMIGIVPKGRELVNFSYKFFGVPVYCSELPGTGTPS